MKRWHCQYTFRRVATGLATRLVIQGVRSALGQLPWGWIGMSWVVVGVAKWEKIVCVGSGAPYANPSIPEATLGTQGPDPADPDEWARKFKPARRKRDLVTIWGRFQTSVHGQPRRAGKPNWSTIIPLLAWINHRSSAMEYSVHVGNQRSY